TESRHSGRGSLLPQGEDIYSYGGRHLAVDASNLDRAVKALAQGKSYGATSAFQRVFHKWDEFIPMLQERMKQLSNDPIELRPFTKKEAKAIGAEADARYFKLIRHTSQGSEEHAAKLTQEGLIVLSPSELSAPKKHGFSTQGSTTGHPAFLSSSSSSLMGLGNSHLGRNLEKEGHQLDNAVRSLIKGKSYGVAVLKNRPIEAKTARAAFDDLSQNWNQLVYEFEERVRKLSDGKSELIPISAKEAGVDVIGYGRYFKLIQNTEKGAETHVVELTAEGFSVLPSIDKF
ncbi:MAG: hypothetical protein ACJ763_18455, partial [Bdellovibrionia bacterium]